MPLEVATYIGQLDPANPTATDPKSQGDDQLRLIKTVLQNSLPGMTAPGTFSAPLITPTPSQFNNTTTLATTAFVQRALGNYQVGQPISEVGNFQVTDVGGAFYIQAAGTYLIPLLSALNLGASLTLLATVPGVVIGASGADQFLLGSVALSTITLNTGDTITVAKVGAFWIVTGGSVSLRGSAGDFGRNLATSGYQKSPSGFLMQWGIASFNSSGVANNFPIAFPSLIVGVFYATGAGGSSVIATTTAISLGGFSCLAPSTGTYPYLAIGA